MKCAWKQLLTILPPQIGMQLDSVAMERLQELRLRVNAPPELNMGGKSVWLNGTVGKEGLEYVINMASRYSPWCAGTMAQGYLTAPGGHRIGICGEAIEKNGVPAGFRSISSLCIRIARDFPGIAGQAACGDGSVLIVGAPGWGKTTLLRDLARLISKEHSVCIVDERGELFPEGLERGNRLDILTGIPKPVGIGMVLRAMGPEYIAVDEITAEADCIGILNAANCGVRLLATAHAVSLQDLRKRDIYRTLMEKGVFQTLLLLRRDKSFCVERMAL